MPKNLTGLAPVFAVADLKSAIAWYAQSLGFSVAYISRDEGDESGESWNYALLENGSVEMHLARQLAEDRTLCSPSNCYVFVSDIENLHARLTAAEADVSDLQGMPWGSIECWLHDPDGNRLVLSQRE